MVYSVLKFGRDIEDISVKNGVSLSSAVHPSSIEAGPVRPIIVTILTVAVIALLPVTHAAPSGLTYLDSTWSSIDGEGGELIALNPNGTILASYHGNDIIFYNTTSLEKITKFSFDEDVAAMEFNPNGSLLAINKRSTVQLKESIRLIDVHNNVILEQNVQADDSFRDLSWSIDGKIIAAQGYDGDVEQYRVPSLTLKNTLYGVHVVDVTCIDYRSDGQYILTGDESGRWAIWDLQGQRQGSYREFGVGLVDCKFSPDGSDITLLGEDGNFTTRQFGHSVRQSMDIFGAKEILFSSNGNKMHISVESSVFRGLNTYDYENLNLVQNTTFFHKVEDIEFIEDEFGRLRTLFVAAGTGELAVYLQDIIPEGFNEPGIDLDGDLVPDDIDPDDDGDGIIDDWDDDFGCDAPDGTPCSRWADLDKIRNIEIYVGSNFVVKDKITLPSEDSSNIRNLSRNAIAKDQVISARETQLFANAMCQNMDHDDVIDQIKDSILLSNGELGDAVIDCEVVSGMELIRDGDSTTQITILITTSFTYSSAVNLPLVITMDKQTLPTEGSIAWLAPAHPISLTFKGDGIQTSKIPLWRNSADDIASVTMNQVSEKNPTAIEIAIKYALHPLAFAVYFGVLFGTGMLIIRRKNKIDFDIDEEYDDEQPIEIAKRPPEIDSDIYFDNDVEETSNRKPVDSNKKEEIPPLDLEEKKLSMPEFESERLPAYNDNYTSSFKLEDNAPTKKRRVSGAVLNKDGPIMATKRKRLVTTSKKVPKTKKVVQGSPKPLRTRKVKPMEVKQKEPKKKKRKPVKRKSKTQEKPVIDEQKLQENLVEEFTKSDE